jgi:hypothetical protein
MSTGTGAKAKVDLVVVGDPFPYKGSTGASFDLRVRTAKGLWRSDFLRCEARDGEAAFAASNSSLAVLGDGKFAIGTGGKSGAAVLISPLVEAAAATDRCRRVAVPMAGGTEASGIFSLGFRGLRDGIAVGGDYTKPNEIAGTAAWTADGGLHWTAAVKAPHGYRSAVAWSADWKAWIAVGTNGSDVSRDGGKTWTALDGGEWNAVSLPYVVGPKGRIARLARAARSGSR